MTDCRTKSLANGFSVSHNLILRRECLKWLIKSNPKITVSHILGAVRLFHIPERLASDLKFASQNLKEYFKGFVEHIMVCEAFQFIKNGPPWPNKHYSSKRKGHSGFSNARDSPENTGKKPFFSINEKQKPF